MEGVPEFFVEGVQVLLLKVSKSLVDDVPEF